MGLMDWTQLPQCKNIRCPYCADGIDFRLMMRQGRSDWYVCGGCGHLALPSSPFYQCICKNCNKLERKRRLFSAASFPVEVSKPTFLGEFQVRLRDLSRRVRRMALSLS